MMKSYRHRNKSTGYETAAARYDSILQAALDNGDASSEDLKSAWNSMGRAKTQLRHAEQKLSDMTKPSSSSILWNLPDYLFSLIDQEEVTNNRSAEQPVNEHSTSEALNNSMNRRTSRRQEKYLERSSDTYDVVSTASDSFSLPADGSTITRGGPQSSFSSYRPSSRQQSSGVDSLNETCDSRLTSATAVRETQINFLNDAVPQRAGGMSRSSVAGKTKRSRVEIRMPSSAADGRDNSVSVKQQFAERDRNGNNDRFDKNGMCRSVTFRQPLVSSANIADERPIRPMNDDLNSMEIDELKDYEQSARNYSVENGLSADSVLSRKVAIGPAGNVYPDEKPSFVKWSSDSHQQPASRIVASPNNNPDKFITAGSWRAGARAAREELGSTSRNGSRPTSASKADTVQRRSELDKRPSISTTSDRRPSNNYLDEFKRRRVEDSWIEKTSGTSKKSHPVKSDVQVKKPTKEITYNTSDVQKFMDKQKMERKRQHQNALAAESKAKLERQHHLEELSRLQQDAVARAKKRPLPANEAWNDGSDKENTEAIIQSSNSVVPSNKYADTSRTGTNRPAAVVAEAQNGTVSSLLPETHPHNVSHIVDDEDDGGELSAEQIVSRFAAESGRSLVDVYSNYTKYADDIKRSFLLSSTSNTRKKPDMSKPTGLPLSAQSRLQALMGASDALKSRLQQHGLQFNNDDDRGDKTWLDAQATVTDRRGKIKFADSTEVEGFHGQLPGVNHTKQRPSADEDRNRVMLGRSGLESVSLVDLADGDDPMDDRFGPDMRNKRNDRSSPVLLHQPQMSLVKSMPGSRSLRCPIKPDPVPQWKSSKIVADPYSVLQVFSRRHKDFTLSKQADAARSFIDRKPLDLFNNESRRHDARSDSEANRGRSASESSQASSWGTSVNDDQNERNSRHREESGRPTRAGRSGKDMKNNDSLRPREGVSLRHSDADQDPTRDRGLDDSVSISRRHEGSRAEDGGDDYISVDSDRFDDKSDLLEPTNDGGMSKALVSSRQGAPGGEVDQSDFSTVSSLTPDTHPTRLTPDYIPPGSTAHRAQPYMTTSQPYDIAAAGKPVILPDALEARMALELNLLDCMEESLRQVNNIENTRAVALSQQETVALAQILKARQQNQAAELQATRIKMNEESLAMAHQRHAAEVAALERQQEAARALIQTTSNSAAALHESVHALTDTQAEAARITAEAARQLAEASSLVLDQQQQKGPNVNQLLAESAATAAAAAAASVLQQLRIERPKKTQHERSSGSRTKPRMSSPPPPSRSNRSSITGTTDHQSDTEDSSSMTGTTSKSRRRSGSASIDSSSVVTAKDSSRPTSARSIQEQSRPTSARSVHTTTDMSRPTSARSTSAASEIHTDVSRPASARSMSAVSEESDVHTGSDQSRQTTVKTASAGDMGSKRVSNKDRVDGMDKGLNNDDKETASVHTEMSQKEYSEEFDTSLSEDELEKSLRDIIPSKDLQIKMRTALSPLRNGRKRLGSDDDEDSFSRFNVSIVQEYLKEEAIRQQHQLTLLLLRQRALKEKTAVELVWLEQQKQELKNKGSDDPHPDMVKKRKNIIRKHRHEQEELKILKEASKLSMEAQRLMLLESRGIKEIHKMTEQVKDKLRDAGIDAMYLSSPDITTEEDVSLHLDDDSVSISESRTHHDKKKSKEKIARQMLDTKFMTERMQHLREGKPALKARNNNLKAEPKTKENKETGGHRSPTPVGKNNSARSITTEEQLNIDTARSDTAPNDTARSHVTGSSISEQIQLGSEQSKSGEPSHTVSSEKQTAVSRRRDDPSSSESSMTDDISEDIDESDKGTSEASAVSDTNKGGGYTEDFDSITVDTGTSQQSIKKPSVVTVKEPKRASKTSAAKPDKKAEILKRAREALASDSEGYDLNHSSSDQSNLEGRVEDLAEELKRRKKEAAELKKQQKEKQKTKLRDKEEQLKNKIEKYNAYIKQVQSERLETAESQSTSDQSKSGPVATSPRRTETAKNKTDKPLAKSIVPKSSEVSEEISDNFLDDHSKSDGIGKIPKLDLIGGDAKIVNPLVTPRTDMHNLDSARTLADIPEDFSLLDSIGGPQRKDSEDRSEKSVGDKSAKTDEQKIKLRTTPANDDILSPDHSQKSAEKSSPQKSVSSYSNDWSEEEDEDDDDKSKTVSKSESSADARKKPSEHAFSSHSKPALGKKSLSAEETDEDISEVPSDKDLHSASDSDDAETPLDRTAESRPIENEAKSEPGNMSIVDAQPEKADDCAKDKNDKAVSDKKQEYAEAAEASVDSLMNEAIDAIIGIKRHRQSSIGPTDNEATEAAERRRASAVAAHTDSSSDTVVWKTLTDIEPDAPVSPVTSLLLPPEFTVSTPINKPEDKKYEFDDIYDELKNFDISNEDCTKKVPHDMNKPEPKVAPVIKPQPKSPVVEVKSVIAMSPKDTAAMIHKFVDHIWKKRSFSDGASNSPPPYAVDMTEKDKEEEGNSANIEARSKTAYNHLIFDLIKQITQDTYKEPDPSDDMPWFKPKGALWSAHRVVPTSAEIATRGIESHVLRLLNPNIGGSDSRGKRPLNRGVKWNDRKRRELVDDILIKELQEDEQQWVDYDRDELNIKMQLADSIFDLLVSETATVMSDIKAKQQTKSPPTQ